MISTKVMNDLKGKEEDIKSDALLHCEPVKLLQDSDMMK